MIGLDTYATTKSSFVGIDWLNLTSSALKGAGGLAGGDGNAAKLREMQRLEAEKKTAAAQATASFWRWIAFGGIAAVVAGYIVISRRGLKAAK